MKIIEEKEGVRRIEGDWLNIFELLEMLRLRPGMYIGEKRITALKTFLQGYQTAMLLNRLPEKSFPDFNWFSTWLKGRINSEFDLSTAWHNHLLSAYDNNEEESVDKFFELLDEFKKCIPVCEIQHITDEQKKYHKHKHSKYWNKKFEQIKSILVFGLPPSQCYWGIYIGTNNNVLSQTTENSRDDILNYFRFNFDLNQKWVRLPKEEGVSLLKSLLKKNA